MPEDLERRSNCKRVRFSTTMEADEEEYYGKKIMKLFEEKRKKFGRQDALVANNQVKERKKVIKRRRPTVVEKKKIDKVPIVSNELTQRLKEYIANEMNGKQVKVVIQKRLFASDLEKSQNRLNMPINQLETHDFLTENEKRDLDNGKEFEVELLGPTLRVHGKPMVMKKWHLRSSDNYVLKTNWNNFVNENEKDLKVNTMIQVWSFRKDEKLHFAIACLERDVHGQNDAVAVAATPIRSYLPPKKRLHFAIDCLERDVHDGQNDAAAAPPMISESHIPPKKRSRAHFEIACLENDVVAAAAHVSDSHLPPKKRLHFRQLLN